MSSPVTPAHIALWLISGWLVIASLLAVTLRNLFRAALALGFALLCVAALFLLLEAEFLGWTQILVYVGAILTLVLFAVMLTSGLADPRTPQSHRPLWPSAIACALLFGLLRQAIHALPWTAEPGAAFAGPGELGRQLVTTYALPFELISVLFVAVMVGSLVLAGRNAA